MGTPKTPNARDQQRRRHHELIRLCLGSKSGSIVFADAATLYREWYPGSDDGTRHKQYRTDCGNLVRHFREMSEAYLSPFFLPVPAVTFDKEQDRLSIVSGQRPIAVAKNAQRELIPARRALARFVADAVWPESPAFPAVAGTPLFPRDGRVYAGHGRTVCIFFHEYLCEQRGKLPQLTVYTASLEVAGLLYYLHQNAGTRLGGIRFGERIEIDRDMGALLIDGDSNPGHIDVAFISCNGIYKKELYSDADRRTHAFARPFLQKADRIVVVAESWKIGRTEGSALPLPEAGTKPVLLVTDAKESEVIKHKPDGFDHLLAPPSDPLKP